MIMYATNVCYKIDIKLDSLGTLLLTLAYVLICSIGALMTQKPLVFRSGKVIEFISHQNILYIHPRKKG